MATGDYTTVAKVKAQLGVTPSTDDDLLTDYVTQASKTFADACGRQFHATHSTLSLDCQPPTLDGRILYFDRDVLSVDQVTNGDGDVIDADHYVLLPLNDSPKYAIELTIAGGEAWTYAVDWRGAIQVIGSLGYCADADRPADVTFAVTKLAAFLYQNRDNREERVQFADGTTLMPSGAPQVVTDVIAFYKRKQIYA